MENLPKYYTVLFNAVTDALHLLEKGDVGSAKGMLIWGQQQAEEAAPRPEGHHRVPADGLSLLGTQGRADPAFRRLPRRGPDAGVVDDPYRRSAQHQKGCRQDSEICFFNRIICLFHTTKQPFPVY